MLYRRAFKWLTITIIVLFFFLAVLLSLGYLLKENKVATTELKTQLAEASQQAKRKQKKQKYLLSALEKSQLKIINTNKSCNTDNQCFLVDTHNPALGCTVAVNKQGVAILIKIISDKQDDINTSVLTCSHTYSSKSKIKAQCYNNQCQF